MPDAEIAVLMLFEFGTGGGQAELARPPHGEVICSEFGAITEMRIPAFSRADVQHAVSSIFDDVATIMELDGEFLVPRGRLGEYNTQEVETANAALLQIHSFILKEGEGFTAFTGDFVHIERAGELKGQGTLAAGFSADADRGGSFQTVVGENGSLDVVTQSAERDKTRGKTGNGVGGPDVVESLCGSFLELAEEEGLVPLEIQDDIKGAGHGAFEGGVKVRWWVLRKAIEENAQRLSRIEGRQRWLPLSGKRRIHLGLQFGRLELAKEFVGGSVGEAKISRKKILIEYRRPEEIAHLLLLRGVAWESQGMTAAGENRVGDISVKRGEKGQGAFFERQNGIAAAEFDPVSGDDMVDGGSIDTESVDRII